MFGVIYMLGKKLQGMIVVCTMLYARAILGQEVYLVQPSDISSERDAVIESFREDLSFQLNGKSLKIISFNEIGKVDGPEDIVIALGESGLTSVLAAGGSSTVIAALISKYSFDKVQADFLGFERTVAAIYSDPSPLRQLALAKVLYGSDINVGVISSKVQAENVNEIEALAADLNINMKVFFINEKEKLSTFIDMAKGIDVLLLLKDKDLYEVVPLDRILLASYDINNVGVIGYSSGIVRSGGLATTYSSLSDISTSLAQVLQRIERGDNIRSHYPENFNIKINKYVRRSLGLKKILENLAKEEILLISEEANSANLTN